MKIRAVSTKREWSRDNSKRGHRYMGHAISSKRKNETRKSRRDWEYQIKPFSSTLWYCD